MPVVFSLVSIFEQVIKMVVTRCRNRLKRAKWAIESQED
jgi:hypothetical protein